MCELQLRGDVADRIDVRHRGLGPVVGGNTAVLRIDGDAGLFQSEIGHVGMAADGKHHEIGGQAGATGKARGELIAMLVHLVDGAAGDHGDAALLDLLAHMRAHIVIESTQNVVAAINQRHVAAVAGEDAGEFERDVAAALHHHALRQLRQMERFVGRDHVLDAGNLRPMVGPAAGGDQHIARRYLLAVGKAQRVRVLEHGAALHHLRA